MEEKKIDWHDELRQLPLSELSRIYKRTKGLRALFTTIPIIFLSLLMFIYGVAGYASYASIMLSAGTNFLSISGVWDVIAAMVCCFVLIAYHGTRGNNIAFLVLALSMIMSILFDKSISIVSLLMGIYIAAVRYPMAKLDDDIALLRAMPTFPFNGRVSDQMINVAEYKRKKQLIESAKGNIYSDNAEQIFDKPVPEMPQYEKGDTPEDYLQRKHMYIDGKYTKTSLTDEEYDRQDDELYERRMFTDKKKKEEGPPPVPDAIPDDGRLQEFDFTDHRKMNEIYIISNEVYTDEFDRTSNIEPPRPDDYVISDDLIIEDMDYTEQPLPQ